MFRYLALLIVSIIGCFGKLVHASGEPISIETTLYSSIIVYPAMSVQLSRPSEHSDSYEASMITLSRFSGSEYRETRLTLPKDLGQLFIKVKSDLETFQRHAKLSAQVYQIRMSGLPAGFDETRLEISQLLNEASQYFSSQSIRLAGLVDPTASPFKLIELLFAAAHIYNEYFSLGYFNTVIELEQGRSFYE